MDANLQALLEEIRELEKSVVEQLKKKEAEIVYNVKNRSVTFKKEVLEAHLKLRKGIYRFFVEAEMSSMLVAPVIYSMVIPIVLLDLFVCVYQRVCFPVYGIPRVIRGDYISLDRHRLKYLNWIEKVNCNYCGYFNGVIAYVREVASRTEQYFCPIRHALRTKGLHSRHAQFVPYGDAKAYRDSFSQLREEVRKATSTINNV